ncbi:MAG TPA: peptidoglycan DD-metalloendopeptidase family protein, partial [Flavisolibacter sp.]
HLGVDIWGPAGVPVYAPLPGTVHSFAFNDAFGDYGATLILEHELEGIIFYTLYGHLSLHSIEDKQEGETVEKGQWIAAFGEPAENGQWPPHLHFQIIQDLGAYRGDYPGVCAVSEKEVYLANCPDPDLVLNMVGFAIK